MGEGVHHVSSVSTSPARRRMSNSSSRRSKMEARSRRKPTALRHAAQPAHFPRSLSTAQCRHAQRLACIAAAFSPSRHGFTAHIDDERFAGSRRLNELAQFSSHLVDVNVPLDVTSLTICLRAVRAGARLESDDQLGVARIRSRNDSSVLFGSSMNPSPGEVSRMRSMRKLRKSSRISHQAASVHTLPQK